MKKFLLISIMMLLWSPSVFAEEATTTPETLPEPVSINLRIESATSTLFRSSLEVSPCAPEASTTPVASGYCAIKQSGLESTWSSFGGAYFLESVSGAANDYAASAYWGWFANLEYGQTSLDQHILVPNEELIVTLGRMPLKIELGTTTPEVGATTTITILEFGFDESWNPLWRTAASSTLTITGETFAADDGHFAYIATSTDIVTIVANKTGYLDRTLTIYPKAAPMVEEADPPEDPPTQNPPIVGGGGVIPATHEVDVMKALQFLMEKQENDGSLGASLYTDWAAIAFAAGPYTGGRDKITAYIKSATPALSSVTDYERHAMALMALGINPYDGTSINYIEKISDAFDGTQIGNVSLVNDDTFALFPLLKAGFTSGDEIIKRSAAFIVSKQRSDGSWEGSVDFTAATIQGLSQVPSLPGVSTALSNAKAYLRSRQSSDGGFGSAFSTSWVMQAIVASGESLTSWDISGKNPATYLGSIQESDGGLEPVSANESTRIWSTAYAIPATIGKPWSAILSSFPRQNIAPPPPVVMNVTINNNQTATTTPTVATTTVTINATSTLAATSTIKASPETYLARPEAAAPIQSPQEPIAESEVPISPSPDPTPLSQPTLELQTAAAGNSSMKWLGGIAILLALSIGFAIYKFKRN